MQDKEYDFLTIEHMAGHHDKVTKGCYICHQEQRLINSKRIVDRERLGNNIALGGDNRQIDDPRFSWSNNPIRD